MKSLKGTLPVKDLYGKFPEFVEVMSVIRNIYGEDFMEIFERGFKNIEKSFDDTNGVLTSSTSNQNRRNQLNSLSR